MRRRPSVELVTLALLCVYLVHSTNFWLRVRVQSDAEVVVLEDATGAEEEEGNDLERRRAAIDPIKPIKPVTLEAVIEPARNASAATSCSDLDKPFVGGEGQVAAVLVLCFNRPAYIRRTLEALRHRLQAKSIGRKFPVYVSQDGDHAEVSRVVESFDFLEARLIHARGPQRGLGRVKPYLKPYYHLSRHYKWALTQIFDCLGFDKAIVIEDDMEVSVDFFAYFEATSHLLDLDPTIYTISSWNDNGFEAYVRDPRRLYRTDFFPGLGWMLTRRLWDTTLREGWPQAFWDDWMREDAQRRGRTTICPEISRNFNFGIVGSSSNQTYASQVAKVVANEVYVNFGEEDLSYLADAEAYREDLRARVDEAAKVALEDLGKIRGDGKIVYASKEERAGIFEYLDLDAESALKGLARGSLDGIIQLRNPKGKHSHVLYISPI